MNGKRLARVRSLSATSILLAVQELSSHDPMLAAIAQLRGVPPMWARRPGFSTLIRIILEQQVSLASAATLYRRLNRHAGGITPDTLAALGIDGLRAFGLTRQKSAYCAALAISVISGSLDFALLSRLPDHDAREMLLEVPGIGPWSADIYQLMALRRPDIWPQGDLALAVTLGDMFKLSVRPSQLQQREIAQRWTPWRSVAARIIWCEYLARRNRL